MRAVALPLAAVVSVLVLAPPAAAQGVTEQSLRGRSIVAQVRYEMKIRRPQGVFDVPVTVNWNLNISSDGRVTGNVTRSSVTPRGPVSNSRAVSTVLGQPREIKGSGHAVMVLAGNTLTVLRTFEAGGLKTTITFGGGSSCTIRAPIMREVGAGPTRRDAMMGGTVEILSSRQVSSSCQLR